MVVRWFSSSDFSTDGSDSTCSDGPQDNSSASGGKVSGPAIATTNR